MGLLALNILPGDCVMCMHTQGTSQMLVAGGEAERMGEEEKRVEEGERK